MAKQRLSVPRGIRERLLDEFNHRCAVCGKDKPHIHHIDEDPSNNNSLNLIPLCPNCHLVDQHNPTQPIDSRKLRLFREYKDPSILKPQFHPLFTRIEFLDVIDPQIAKPEQVEVMARELISLVSNLEMGPFYAERLTSLLKRPSHMYAYNLYSGPSREMINAMNRHGREYCEQVQQSRNEVYRLIVELLRYQNWK